MSTYLIPDSGNFDELSERVKTAGATLITPQSVRELILNENDSTLVIAGVSAMDMMVISRHSDTLMAEMPSVVMSVPGIIYPGDWMSAAAIFPPMDFKEIEGKLLKSGTTAFTPAQGTKRGRGAPIRTLESGQSLDVAENATSAEEGDEEWRVNN